MDSLRTTCSSFQQYLIHCNCFIFMSWSKIKCEKMQHFQCSKFYSSTSYHNLKLLSIYLYFYLSIYLSDDFLRLRASGSQLKSYSPPNNTTVNMGKFEHGRISCAAMPWSFFSTNWLGLTGHQHWKFGFSWIWVT